MLHRVSIVFVMKLFTIKLFGVQMMIRRALWTTFWRR